MTKRHLDLGCGFRPRNPYGYAELFGCDLLAPEDLGDSPGFSYRQVNLSLQPIPFPDSFFDSVSAFDFLEHVPRQLVTASGEFRNPFIDLMNEIHRVLRPGGRLWAVTPAYPHASAFADPTHVNFITEGTHRYFCGPDPAAKLYGFTGRFDVVNVARETPANVLSADVSPFRRFIRRLHRRTMSDGLSHFLWELAAVKDAAA
jgi:SAM-dependent methyltransferase